jgi:hypothetical protein
MLMSRLACLLATFLIAVILFPHPASAAAEPQTDRHAMSGAMARKEAACKKQANAQKLNFTSRLDFLEGCMKDKPK